MTAARGAAFAAAMRMVDRVHHDAAHMRPDALPAIASRLAHRLVRTVGVGDGADRRHALAAHNAQFAGRQFQLRITAIAADELNIGAGGTGELRIVRGECMATIGAVSNPDKSNESLGKAGRNRWKGIRPLTRGVAKNPVDHPHVGGEGRTSGGRHPVTPWGKGTKGNKTRNNKVSDRMIIRRRNKK